MLLRGRLEEMSKSAAREPPAIRVDPHRLNLRGRQPLVSRVVGGIVAATISTRAVMSRRLLALPIAFVFLVLLAGHCRAADFVDSAERYVLLRDRIGRVMAADQAAAVLIYVLAPEKLVGWSRPLSREQRAYIPAKIARLPVVGQLTGPNPTAGADAVARLRPDLIIETGVASPEAAALADQIQQQTGVPYILLDGSIQHTPYNLEVVGRMLGVAERGGDLAYYTRTAIDSLRGRLLVTESTSRPLVYYGRGTDGLETGLARSQAMADIDQAGAINVAARLGSGQLTDKQLEALVRRAEAQPGETRRPIDVPLLGAEPVPLPGPSPVPQGRPPGRGGPLPGGPGPQQ